MFYPLTLLNRARRTPTAPDQAGADPFYRLHRDMNRLFDEAFSDFGLPGAFSGSFAAAGAPSVDIRETDKTYEVEAELPGVEEDDIHVELADNVLTLRGEKRFEREEEGKKNGYHVMERSYGSFARSIPLPFDADPDAVEAVFRNGVLKLSIPKPPEAETRSRRIAVKRG